MKACLQHSNIHQMFATIQFCIQNIKPWSIYSVKRYQQSKIGTVFQVGIAVQLQYCDNWQFGIHNVA